MSEAQPLNDQNRDNDRQNNNQRRRRRRRRRRKGGGGGEGGGGEPAQQADNQGGGRNRRRRRRRKSRPHGSGQHQQQQRSGGNARLDPFELFAAYLLGLDQNGRYRKQGATAVARRFGCGKRDVHDALNIFHMDNASLRRMRFDAGLAELDIKVAPEGIDRGEIAKTLYQEFLECGRAAGLFEDQPSYPAPEEPEEEPEGEPEEEPEEEPEVDDLDEEGELEASDEEDEGDFDEDDDED